jgi:hypothetical protein
LVRGLTILGIHKVAITPARGNEDALLFASEIESAFTEAGWTIVPTGKLKFITKDAIGLGILVKEAAGGGFLDSDLTPDQAVIGKAFSSIGMPLTGNPNENVSAADPVEIYVGLP